MKKVIISTALLALTIVGLQASAVVDSDRLMSEDYLINQGYSPEMVRMINVRKVDPYAQKQVEETPKNPLKWIKRFYQYVDPATDNQIFGRGVIDPRLDRPSQLR